MPTSKNILTYAAGSLVLAAGSVALWWGWLGWDNEYQFDAATQSYSGPYEAWQVAGCVLSLIALGVLATFRLPPWLVAGVMTISFTVAWSRHAAAADETGMWGVGAFLLMWGMGAVAFTVTYATYLARRLRRNRGEGRALLA
jgi:hypothetical protein